MGQTLPLTTMQLPVEGSQQAMVGGRQTVPTLQVVPTPRKRKGGLHCEALGTMKHWLVVGSQHAPAVWRQTTLAHGPPIHA
mgnify:CR=1 FL=1